MDIKVSLSQISRSILLNPHFSSPIHSSVAWLKFAALAEGARLATPSCGIDLQESAALKRYGVGSIHGSGIRTEHESREVKA